MKSEVARIITSGLTSNSLAVTRVAALKIELEKVNVRVKVAEHIVIRNLRLRGLDLGQ
jgi:hypothetical protein